MRATQIKSIPKDVQAEIKLKDVRVLAEKSNRNITRYYAYFDKLKTGEVVKVTVAVKTLKSTKKLMMKQVAVRNLAGQAFARDMEFTYIGGYSVCWDYNSDWVAVDDQYFNPWAYQICLGRLADTLYKYSGYKECAEQGIDVLEYLKIWNEYPKVELLMKAGLGWLAMKKSVVKKCEADKAFSVFIRENINYLKSDRPRISTILSAYKRKMPIQKMELICEFLQSKENVPYLKDIITVIPQNEYEKFIDYIVRNNINKASYSDYAHACIGLGVDMLDTKNKYPKDFEYWHSMRINQYYAKTKTNIVVEGMLDVFCKYKNLQYTGAYSVFIAKNRSDLENEGGHLHHCVGRMDYDVRMIKEQSLIFFVRENENPAVPFVTLEYSLESKKVIQCYGDHDSKPSQDVLDFVYNKWQPYAKRKLSAIRRAVA